VFLLFLYLLHSQQKQVKIVVLGSAYMHSCIFQSDSNNVFINSSVADFSSGQLFWTLGHGVLVNDPDYCLIQTGSIDVLLGIPGNTVLSTLDKFHENFTTFGIEMLLLEDLPLWENDSLDAELSRLSSEMKQFCSQKNIRFISLDEVGLGNFGPKDKKPVIQEETCQKLQLNLLSILQE
jgi:hypothetical protein